MNICFTASRLMKASEVRRFCQQARENRLHLMVMERRAKQKLREIQAKQKIREIQQEKRPVPQH
jgi:acetone carboxylase gamma subunit